MRKIAAALLAAMLAAHAMAAPAAATRMTREQALAHANELLARVPLFDGHNDLPIAMRPVVGPTADLSKYDLRQRTRGQTDIPRLRAGHVGAQFWSVYIPAEAQGGYARMQLEQIALARRVIDAYPEALGLARTADEVEAQFRAGRIASLLGMEGGYALENSLGTLRAYYDLGVRYMTLTHSTHTDWADSAGQVPARHNGLTPFGEDVVREMNRLGMLVDLAHVSDATMRHAMRVSQAPVIFSHSSARALCDVPRNVPDDVLRDVRANGGVVMINFMPEYVSQDYARRLAPVMAEFGLRARALGTMAEKMALLREMRAAARLPVVTAADVADHVEHVRRVAGVDHVGLGSDFDGALDFPEGLSDVSMYPNLFAELVLRGWTDEDLARLAGGNLLRVMRTAEAVAARLQAERTHSR